MLVRRSRESGDTLIEVLLAVTILAVVITGVMSIMNFGLASGLGSQQRAEIQAMMNGQANMLRAARDEHSRLRATGSGVQTDWEKILLKTAGSGNLSADSCVVGSGATPFAFLQGGTNWLAVNNAATTNISNTNRVPVPGNGLWIEGYESPASSGPRYYDFYLKACWSGYGSGAKNTLQSVVRLYEN